MSEVPLYHLAKVHVVKPYEVFLSRFVVDRYSCQFENNYFTEICSGSEAGSHFWLTDFVYHSALGVTVMMKEKRVGGVRPPRQDESKETFEVDHFSFGSGWVGRGLGTRWSNWFGIGAIGQVD
jgi:hypothetical protein